MRDPNENLHAIQLNQHVESRTQTKSTSTSVRGQRLFAGLIFTGAGQPANTVKISPTKDTCYTVVTPFDVTKAVGEPRDEQLHICFKKITVYPS